ncbi:hypothetical protein [Marinithermofilum abyssi]|nr:hypothetical protein [Marinithermofilum abyssi]
MWRTIRKIGWPLVPFNGGWNTPLLWRGVQQFFEAPYWIPGWGLYGGAGNIQPPVGLPGTPFFAPQYSTGERGMDFFSETGEPFGGVGGLIDEW